MIEIFCLMTGPPSPADRCVDSNTAYVTQILWFDVQTTRFNTTLGMHAKNNQQKQIVLYIPGATEKCERCEL